MTQKTSGFFSGEVRLSGLAAIVGAGLCLATLLGFAGKYAWYFDLLAHFRVQYLIGLGIYGLVFLALQQHRKALIFLACAAVNLAVIAPLYFGDGRMPATGSLPMRALLLNVNTRHGNSAKVLQLISDTNPDFIVLEEISSRWLHDLRPVVSSYPYWLAQPREDNFGIALYSRLPITAREISEVGFAGVPSIIATISSTTTSLRLIATHPLPPISAAYSRGRNQQLQAIADLAAAASPPLIVLGDLNSTPWSYNFKKLLSRSGLKNSAVGFGIQPSWPANIPPLLIPIDQCLHSPDIAIINRKIGGNTASDHLPLIVDLAIGPGPR